MPYMIEVRFANSLHIYKQTITNMSKNIFKITRKELKKVIKESLEKALSASNNSIHLFEMATIGAQKWGKDTYSIQIHGASTADRVSVYDGYEQSAFG